MKKVLGPWLFHIMFVLLVGCAGVPVREAVKIDLNIPVGQIEGNQFTGLRYPFKASVPSLHPDYVQEFSSRNHPQ
ncbi:MAG: hypothetical protein KG012_05660 [Deltaproteobacteria bacterium]|nr:hypothetical protein [Deltaproteobacteria bacterium]